MSACIIQSVPKVTINFENVTKWEIQENQAKTTNNYDNNNNFISKSLHGDHGVSLNTCVPAFAMLLPERQR